MILESGWEERTSQDNMACVAGGQQEPWGDQIVNSACLQWKLFGLSKGA